MADFACRYRADVVVVLLSIADLVIRVLAVGIIPGNRRPTTAMAWLLGIFFVPFLGLVLFLLFGNFKLSSRRRRAAADGQQRVRAGISALADVESDYPGPEWVTSAGGTEPPAGVAARWWTATPWS